MKTFQTVGAEADAELTSALGAGARLYKDGILDGHTIKPIRLNSTYEETKRLLFERSVLRPAFKVIDNSVDLPVLFFKADGDIDELVRAAHDFRRDHNKTTLYYTSFNLLNTVKPSKNNISVDLNEETSLKHLQMSKFNLVVAAYAEIKAYVKDNYPSMEETTLYDALIIDNAKMIEALHYSDIEKTAPKVIVNSVQHDQLNDVGLLRLKFASELGFDVCVLSKDGFASIENDLPKDALDHYVLTPADSLTKDGYLNEPNQKFSWKHTAIIILIVLVIIRIITWFN